MKVILLTLAAALCLSAQDAKTITVPQELLGKATAPAPAARKTEAQAAAPSPIAPTVVSDGYELEVSADAPVTVPAGQFHIFDQSKLDFTGLSHARIALVTVNGQDLSNAGIMASWASTGTYFNVTDLLIGNGTLGVDAGTLGLYTPAYGPFLKLVVVNGGSTPVQIKQLSVYAAK